MLNLHQAILALLDRLFIDFFVEREAGRVIDVRIREYAHPIEFRGFDEIAQFIEIRFGFAGESHDERRAQSHAGNGRADAAEQLQERVAIRSALHPRQDVAAGVLQRHIHVLREARVRGNGVEQALRHAVRIAVEEAHPLQAFDSRQAFHQHGQAIAQSQVFAVGSRVLSDERHFADSCRRPDFPLRAQRTQTAGCEIFRATAE